MDKICLYCGKIIKDVYHSKKYHKLCLKKRISERAKEYHIKNKERRNKKSKEYYNKNRDILLQKTKEYYNKNKERQRTLAKLRYYKNREEIRQKRKEYSKRYYKKNKECYKEHQKTDKYKARKKSYYQENKEIKSEYHQTNREKILKRQKKYRQKNPEKIREGHKKYNQTERGRILMKKIKQKRRALKKNCIDTLTKKELKIIQERDKSCVYCSSNKNLGFDHIISFNKGGENSFLNGVIACRSCNSSKGYKDVFEWCKSKRYKVPKIIINNLRKMGSQNGR